MKALRQYADIIAFRAKAVMQAEASQTYLNVLWWIFDPLLSMAIYYVVFAIVLERRTPDFAVFLIVGLVVWQWFGNTATAATMSICNARILVSRVVYSKSIFPLTVVLINTYKFLLTFALLLVLLWLLGHGASTAYVYLPGLLVVQFALIVGAAMLLASIAALVPDVQHVVGHVVRVLMFMSAIFYSIDDVPERLRPVFLCNPMVSLIESYRAVLMYGQPPDFGELQYALIFAAVVLAVACAVIRKMDPHFPRLVEQI